MITYRIWDKKRNAYLNLEDIAITSDGYIMQCDKYDAGVMGQDGEDHIVEPGFTSPTGDEWFAGDVVRDAKHTNYDNGPMVIRFGWFSDNMAYGFYLELEPSRAKCFFKNIDSWQPLGTVHDKAYSEYSESEE